MIFVENEMKGGFVFSCLVPGIRAWANQRGCDFWWDGFLPAIKYKDSLEQLDLHRLERLAKADKYTKLNIQINNAIERVITKQGGHND